MNKWINIEIAGAERLLLFSVFSTAVIENIF